MPACAEPIRTLTVASMPTVVFTGDSQSCGRNLAVDFPQLASRIIPARVINTAVGGSNSSALLYPMTGGTVRVAKGERVLHGENVRWGMGPFPGMTVVVNGERYTIDHVAEHPRTPHTEMYVVEPARADYEGEDCHVEPGWDVRVAQHKPDVVCLMFINDGTMPDSKQDDWREMIRRIRAMGAVPVLMSPVPVDSAAEGGNHPGSNDKYAQNAAAVRALAEAEQCWFVDVFNLYFALDPGLRGIVRDGIHPDTDGSTLIVNGLKWVFQQMGLREARPFLKGWALTPDQANITDLIKSAIIPDLPAWASTGAGEAIPQLGNYGIRPFRISQPDHPDPDHQDEARFTLDAIRRNDEYGLVAERDGLALDAGDGLLFAVGLPRGMGGSGVTVRVTTTEVGPPEVWAGDAGGWQSLATRKVEGWFCGVVPGEAAGQDGVLWVRLLAAGEGAELDALAVDLAVAAELPRWQPSDATPRAQALASDHAHEDNLIRNADFAAGGARQADHWSLSGNASVNRPFKRQITSVSFVSEDDRRLAELVGAEGAREFDTIHVTGSGLGNDGAYRIRTMLDDGRVQVRRRSKAVESGLAAELVHDDGCGLVPGSCCVEVAGDGAAWTTVELPRGAESIRATFFYRVFDPTRLGTRDVPGSEARVSLAFHHGNGDAVGEPWLVEDLPCSYQWQKAELAREVPQGAVGLSVTFRSASSIRVQFTGAYVAVDGRRATP